MTPEEFRQKYSDSQDRLGNTLQSLISLGVQFNALVDQIIADYSEMNQVVAEFLNQWGDEQDKQNHSNEN